MRAIALSLLLVSTVAGADVLPMANRDDPRMATIAYAKDNPVRLATAPGSELTILLGAGEHITNVQLSDYARYQVTISKARDSLVLQTSAVTYQNASQTGGTMKVNSDVRAYSFVLINAPATAPTPYVLHFTYGHGAGASHHSGAVLSQYRLTGNREVQPSSIHDDGAKTFIEWPADAAIPAVFALEHGREEMVNGFERSGVFTIDRVHKHLVFRIDKFQADAVRRSGNGSS
jgi:type IV secretion system protein VirB9